MVIQAHGHDGAVAACATKGNKVHYDKEIKGFGVRVTAAGTRAFVLNYRQAGREKRITIGGWPVWTTKAARDRAKILLMDVDLGKDPLATRRADRSAPTFAESQPNGVEELLPSRRATTQKRIVHTGDARLAAPRELAVDCGAENRC